MRAVRKIGAGQTPQVVVDEFRSSTQLVNRGALLADGVVFNLGNRAVRESRLPQAVQLVEFVAGGNRFGLTLGVSALDGLAGAIAISVICESSLVTQRVGFLRQITARVGVGSLGC